ncbi:MAG: glycoside hydrolase [Planctomycetes bacterium]|nr:glycoside hydrolase [Planctomycetota bacterium]
MMGGTRRRWTLIALLLVTSGSGASIHGAADGGPAVRVVHLPEGALVPDATMDEDGVLHLVYGLGDDAWYVHSADNGRTFSAPVRVNTAGKVTLKMGERGPKLALGRGGSIHVVWADQWSPGMKVYPRYSRSRDGGRTFESPRALGSLWGIDGLTTAADSEGNVVAFFHQVTPGQPLAVPEAHRLYLVRSIDDGATFGAQERLRIRGMDDLACSMCMMRARITADGNVCLALRVANDNIRDFFLLRGPKRENDFAPLRVNEDHWELKTCPMCGPELTVDPAGRMLCAFMSRHRVYWSALDDGRFTLHVPTPAAEDKEIYPAACGNGKGHVLLVWQVGPMAVGRTAVVKWGLYGRDGVFTGKQGTVGVSTSGTKATAFAGTDGVFYIVTTAK